MFKIEKGGWRVEGSELLRGRWRSKGRPVGKLPPAVREEREQRKEEKRREEERERENATEKR